MKKLTAIILLLALLLSGCGAAAKAESDYAANRAPADLYYASPEYGFAKDENLYVQSESKYPMEEAPNAPDNTTGQGVQSQKLIRKISLEAETNNLDELLATLDGRIDLLGGYVEDKSVRTGGSYRTANLTIRIPVSQLDSFVEHVAGTSNILSQTENADDVTLSYVATQSRITALETEHARLLELLAKAEDLKDLLLIEERLTNVRYELENVTSQLRLYDNLVDYGTVNIYVREVKEYTPVEKESVWQRIGGGFAKSLSNMGTFLVEVFIGIIVAIPYLALPVIAVVLLIVLLRRKRKAKKAKQTSQTEPEVE